MGRQAPTLEDVARQAGVSRATVSRVVNGVRNVDPLIQHLVRQAIVQTGYAPNRAARSLVTRRAETIVLVVTGAGDASGENQDAFAARVFADPFFGRVVAGVVGFLRPRSIHPVLMFADCAEDRQEVVTYLRQGRADGALVVSTDADDPLPELLAREKLHAVLFARPASRAPLSYVDLDHRKGGQLAAQHLLERGCRRPVTVAGPLAVSASQERLTGFRETLARNGHPNVPVIEAGFTLDSGISAMTQLLARYPDLDGVFAANDLMAQGACQVLREGGRRVPDDVAVIGFDDSGIALKCRPSLTTVRQPIEQMAAEMACLLDGHIRGKRTEPASVIFAPELIVRETA